MDQRVGWLLATLALWWILRTLVRRRRPVTRAGKHWLSGQPPRVRERVRLRIPKSPLKRTDTRPSLQGATVVQRPPHAFPHRGPAPGTWYNLTTDGDVAALQRQALPIFHTPEELAAWLKLPVGRLGWLSDRCTRNRPIGYRQSHYVYNWHPKRSGGVRLIESPKASLKAVQQQILREILQKLPCSPAAHGFVSQRSIRTNATPHVGSAVVVKFDLQNFYGTVSANRVIRLFRRAGYCREAAIWLAHLTTSRLPGNLPIPEKHRYAQWDYRRRHLPQGAPTSPALANLVAYELDQRLAALGKSFGAVYTRYADDLTFSGDEHFAKSLHKFIPLVEQIICKERFRSNRSKRQVLRSHQRQVVAGVVVNSKPNVSRRDFDRLKAILHLCVVHGPASQNRDQHENFAEHLRGRIAHVLHLNPQRGEKLLKLLSQIPW